MYYFSDKCRDMNQSNTPREIVSEPAATYGLTPNKYNHLVTILGGSKTLQSKVNNEMDLIALSRAGLPKKSLTALSKKLNISMERLSQLLHVSHRTLQRKSPTDHLSVHVSEQILAIAEVVRRGVEVLGSESALDTWLQSELPALADRRPIDLMDTSFGTQLLLKVLGRIEHGVY